MLATRMITLTLICLFSSGTYALSCKGMDDRIIASCSHTACDNPIYIREVSSRLACARRPEVIEAPSWAQDILEYEVSREEVFEGRKLYELVLEKRYWGAKLAFENAAQYIEMVENHLPTTSTINVLKAKNIDEVEVMWKSKESKSLLIDRAWIAADWIGLFMSLIFLILSVIYFNSWANKLINVKYLALSVLLQASIFSTMFWLPMWDHFLVKTNKTAILRKSTAE